MMDNKQTSRKKFKNPPKRFHPKGLSVLYEDYDILVVDKRSGLLTMSTDRVKENTAYFLLTDYVRKGNSKSKNRIFIVHRLDRETSGVLVFAKTESAKRYLQDGWSKFSKKYYAVVHGHLPEKEGLITSYLTENSIHRMYSVSDPKDGKLSKTQYKVIKESKYYSLLEIELLTGRKNQIRVHLAEKGCPVAGDKIYGEKGRGIKRLTLHAASVTITHPHTKEKMTFKTEVPVYFESLVKWKGKEHGAKKR
ncbi:MAG: RluA family pseudouridine synthase [Spirochaetales bacterium]|nr:RluA family pseudouridine synthase [Spirochaetales bacterium]